MDATSTAVLERWWETFATTGRLPEELQLVQGRLIRSVYQGLLPSGAVFVKVMTFPRAKDRLRYCCRALPAVHEAAMLRAAAAAGLLVPEVLAVRTARRFGLPSHSFLALKALPVASVDEPSPRRLRDEAAIALQLLGAGIEHGDLHGGNFVRLADGGLAVLDLQSARRWSRPRLSSRSRTAAAARLLREHLAAPRELGDLLGAALRAARLVHDGGELAAAWTAARHEQRHFERSRVRRCLGESTEFRREVCWTGIVHRTRTPLPKGRWLPPSSEAKRQWLGQRARQVFEGAPSTFPAFFRKWWWPLGKGALYVPEPCSEARIEAELLTAAAGFAKYRSVIEPRWSERHGAQNH